MAALLVPLSRVVALGRIAVTAAVAVEFVSITVPALVATATAAAAGGWATVIVITVVIPPEVGVVLHLSTADAWGATAY
jgi:hypothetical protein